MNLINDNSSSTKKSVVRFGNRRVNKNDPEYIKLREKNRGSVKKTRDKNKSTNIERQNRLQSEQLKNAELKKDLAKEYIELENVLKTMDQKNLPKEFLEKIKKLEDLKLIMLP